VVEEGRSPVSKPPFRHINDRETAEVFLGLDERPVSEYGRTATRVDTAHPATLVFKLSRIRAGQRGHAATTTGVTL
jgi:hypothetical protein